ncbi:putative integral membrane protein [Streptomyces ambofaciens ATCC 23877]|uniref:TVP38/TMEM64 family membrane protein n=1 Tax=Streptomyces ambofaciens (strain ATCC 23877 / 3486 / DSM 40053 / JCM 4204 / NBRC 12836 / NRRL B-2516) TaxID=278992 RepID=A3KKP7_STRA7|nr:TVP38/TMEM64 family protein [Streptomyces ambofaciens]AKZ54445.1 putative integral membrane protein [Streptomyces ambofaciens ATCC 23877]CAJ90284.1 putative integral membrane protein [Streptomyces ambofaciens ATCC 23877]
MLDATTRSGGTATVSPRATATELAVATAAGPAAPTGLAARVTRVLLSPWSRLSLLLALLASAATTVLLFRPQELLTDGWPPQLGGATAALAYAVAYGLCTVAFVPRPLLNLAAGALFGSQLGLASALAGTVLGAGIAFCLGRVLGQEALRPLLRGKWLKAADGQLSRHGFRSMLAARLFPGVPFAAANYCAAVSRMGLLPFLLATALGSIPNTAAYVVAGARASTPTSPAFLIALACIALPGLAGAAVAWRKRHRLRGH